MSDENGDLVSCRFAQSWTRNSLSTSNATALRLANAIQTFDRLRFGRHFSTSPEKSIPMYLVTVN
jgi:hypothetical protein